MKRSEILSEMEKYIKHGIGVSGNSLYPPDMIAKRVLEAIEKKGMLPPPKDGLVKLQEKDGELFLPLFGWEDDDEKI